MPQRLCAGSRSARCQDSVARNHLILEPWKVAVWEAAFDAGLVTSDAGALLLGATDRAIRMMDRFALCFHEERRPEYIEHEVATLVGQRVFGIALGYEDLNDHNELRHDPMIAILPCRRRDERRAPLRREIAVANTGLRLEESCCFHSAPYYDNHKIMTQSIRDNQKKGRGRPATGVTPMVGVRIDPLFQS